MRTQEYFRGYQDGLADGRESGDLRYQPGQGSEYADGYRRGEAASQEKKG